MTRQSSDSLNSDAFALVSGLPIDLSERKSELVLVCKRVFEQVQNRCTFYEGNCSRRVRKTPFDDQKCQSKHGSIQLWVWGELS
eukprot:scaffold4300_cov64-Attheya_sp.AAC.1